MGIYRVEKTNNYSVMSNYHFKDKRLSWKAKGLLSTFLSLPDNWDYKVHGLAEMSTDGEASVKAGLKELEEYGYLDRNPIREKGKIIDWEYIIYEKPATIDFTEVLPVGDFPLVDNPLVEKPLVENPTQLNTNKLNTKKLNNSASEVAPNTPLKEDTNKKENDFEKLWDIYPSKKGKSKAFNSYCSWLKGKKYMNKTLKLTNAQMWYAIKKYVKECESSKRFFQNGSTFFNNTIVEYVEFNND